MRLHGTPLRGIKHDPVLGKLICAVRLAFIVPYLDRVRLEPVVVFISCSLLLCLQG